MKFKGDLFTWEFNESNFMVYGTQHWRRPLPVCRIYPTACSPKQPRFRPINKYYTTTANMRSLFLFALLVAAASAFVAPANKAVGKTTADFYSGLTCYRRDVAHI